MPFTTARFQRNAPPNPLIMEHNMTDKRELKPCPFCGGKAAIPWPGAWKFDLTRTMYTGCFNHDAHPAFTMPVDAWNTRPASGDAVEAELKSGAGYKAAWREIADLLAIPSQPISPREVHETQVMPRLRAALRQPASVEAEPVALLRTFDGAERFLTAFDPEYAGEDMPYQSCAHERLGKALDAIADQVQS